MPFSYQPQQSKGLLDMPIEILQLIAVESYPCDALKLRMVHPSFAFALSPHDKLLWFNCMRRNFNLELPHKKSLTWPAEGSHVIPADNYGVTTLYHHIYQLDRDVDYFKMLEETSKGKTVGCQICCSVPKHRDQEFIPGLNNNHDNKDKNRAIKYYAEIGLRVCYKCFADMTIAKGNLRCIKIRPDASFKILKIRNPPNFAITQACWLPDVLRACSEEHRFKCLDDVKFYWQVNSYKNKIDLVHFKEQTKQAVHDIAVTLYSNEEKYGRFHAFIPPEAYKDALMSTPPANFPFIAELHLAYHLTPPPEVEMNQSRRQLLACYPSIAKIARACKQLKPHAWLQQVAELEVLPQLVSTREIRMDNKGNAFILREEGQAERIAAKDILPWYFQQAAWLYHESRFRGISWIHQGYRNNSYFAVTAEEHVVPDVRYQTLLKFACGKCVLQWADSFRAFLKSNPQLKSQIGCVLHTSSTETRRVIDSHFRGVFDGFKREAIYQPKWFRGTYTPPEPAGSPFATALKFLEDLMETARFRTYHHDKDFLLHTAYHHKELYWSKQPHLDTPELEGRGGFWFWTGGVQAVLDYVFMDDESVSTAPASPTIIVNSSSSQACAVSGNSQSMSGTITLCVGGGVGVNPSSHTAI